MIKIIFSTIKFFPKLIIKSLDFMTSKPTLSKIKKFYNNFFKVAEKLKIFKFLSFIKKATQIIAAANILICGFLYLTLTNYDFSELQRSWLIKSVLAVFNIEYESISTYTNWFKSIAKNLIRKIYETSETNVSTLQNTSPDTLPDPQVSNQVVTNPITSQNKAPEAVPFRDTYKNDIVDSINTKEIIKTALIGAGVVIVFGVIYWK